ncbi:hypothetical protein ACO0KY_09445 [Undibacterium sp. Dicai25W]|uniref:hypothetical protein n=1 Tax=Undibacterium sp. Dicai25W TaxID=3413034 RepID=UPI003BEF8C94
MNQLLSRIAGLMIASSFVFAPLSAQAENAPAKTKVSSKAKKAVPTPVEQDPDEIEPDVKEDKNYEYTCELGNSLTMYTHGDNIDNIAMRWKKRLYVLHRVDTTTGAYRFENTKAGFVWIGIPAKGLLLDSRKGQQLANECHSTVPMVADATPAVAPADAAAAPAVTK